MTTNTLLLLLLAVVFAGVLSYFQYLFKVKNQSKLDWFLAFLRFFSLFSLMLLLINPVLNKTEYILEKTPLPIIVDNSKSIDFLGVKSEALTIFNKLITNSNLQKKFEVYPYLFDERLLTSKSATFSGKQTLLTNVATELKSVFRNKTYPVVILTDGNQTSGDDYVYAFDSKSSVYPVVLGDTTAVFDLKINQVNVNKYAFLKNKFPVEVFVNYTGNDNVLANFSIQEGKKSIAQQVVSFSPSKKSVQLQFLLPAEKVGLHLYKAIITSTKKERNLYNNSSNFAVDVLDQKTTIGIVSAFNHPDLGALKRAIETNAQRKVQLLSPKDINIIKDCNVVVFYQPNNSFQNAFEAVKSQGLNSLIVTGLATDFTFVNQQQGFLDFKMSSQKEDYTPSFNANFNLFALENMGYENFPPLSHPFGKITYKENVSVLLTSKIRTIDSGNPLLSFVEDGQRRMAFLNGENSWKWRLNTYATQNSFEKYDIFIDKMIQFLATKKNKKALEVEFEHFYNEGDAITWNAYFFNKNYEFDQNAQLNVTITNSQNKKAKVYNFLRGNGVYQVNLDGLSAGSYNFVVKELTSNSTFSGNFEILDFDIEKQFVIPDYLKLSQLASQNQGKVYLSSEVEQLLDKLLKDTSFTAIEKEKKTQVPLIDWKWLLVVMLLFLSVEWFVRKYYGRL